MTTTSFESRKVLPDPCLGSTPDFGVIPAEAPSVLERRFGLQRKVYSERAAELAPKEIGAGLAPLLLFFRQDALELLRLPVIHITTGCAEETEKVAAPIGKLPLHRIGDEEVRDFMDDVRGVERCLSLHLGIGSVKRDGPAVPHITAGAGAVAYRDVVLAAEFEDFLHGGEYAGRIIIYGGDAAERPDPGAFQNTSPY